ncbi:MAG: N-acetylmuramoyl-L-alanine amidase [Oscillospiraceae bacterium]|jgi:N-acetylmuramoyl-L-alanine amidase|nr:N-acetylmuramoyl-L-alanine amidase [Oscillospiraceae bacterium]
MKKIVCAVICLFALTAAVSADDNGGGVPFFYENPRAIIITHPASGNRVTSSPRTSFLGACDPDFPLYMNGEEIRTTENGFFSLYVGLERGENVFAFTNGENAETVTVTREPPEQKVPAETVWYETVVYGSTEYDGISRFADYNDDLYMRSPLAKGTVFRVLGERGDCYIIGDGTYVFKNNAYLLDRLIPEIAVSSEKMYDEYNCTYLLLEVNENALYGVDLRGDNASVKIYSDSEVVYEKELEFDSPPVGYTVEFTGEGMEIGFRRPPALLSEAVALIDAGHGGTDPGALGPPGAFGAAEKDFNLYVAEKARDYLLARGISVVFVRDGDVDYPVRERVLLFKERPDISVCVHANSSPIDKDFSELSGPLMFYTLDLSEKAAESVLGHIAAETGADYTPPKRQNFAMARYAGCPAMLFEMGFLCNPDEYERLLSVQYLDGMGTALGEAIEKYLLETAEDDLSESAPTDGDYPPAAAGVIEEEEPPPASEPAPAPEEPEPSGYMTQNRGLIIMCVVLFGALLIAIEPKSIKN